LDDPTLINQSPYDLGWIVKIKPDFQNDFSSLMSAQEFEKYIGAFFRKS